MKALVLDGSHEGDSLTSVAVQGMTSALAGRGTSVELVKPPELAIAPCEGMPSRGGGRRAGIRARAKHPERERNPPLGDHRRDFLPGSRRLPELCRLRNFLKHARLHIVDITV